MIASALGHYLKRYLRVGLINRLISYALVNLAAYMLLLSVVILSDASLLVFHLPFFCTLSLLPFFLLVGTERTTLRRVVRSIDEHCLVESYLHTPSSEHRSLMRRRVAQFLERGKRVNPFPLRLFKGNLYLIGVCLLLFALLQGISFAVLDDFSLSLAPRKIKEKLTERAAAEEAVGELPADDSGNAASSEGEALRPASGGKTGEQRIGKTAEEEALEKLLGDEPLPAKERIRRLGPEDLQQRSEPASERGDTDGRLRVPGSESDTRAEDASAIAGEEDSQASGEGSGAEAGSDQVGRTFRESPIREYTTVAQPQSAEGTRELSPSTNLGDRRSPDPVSALISDFQRIDYLNITFDPLFDAIRESYLRLIDERF
jgi:hypothetical protein